MAISSLIKDLKDQDFQFFKDTVYKECGIKLTELKRALVQSRLLKRMRILELADYTDYANYLRTHYGDEIEHFINLITTNKTDFFRESQHFDFLMEEGFPEIEKNGESEVRIWSAGCSTGEEPYTIAITCQEYFKNIKEKTPKILATDIDTQVLTHASNGIYKELDVEVMPESILKQYFFKGVNENKGLYKVKDFVRKMITFKRLNLLDKEYPMKKKFHIIFCRNVIIYFDKETQRDFFNRLHNYIDDNGYLFIGHSENLSVVSDKFKLMGKTIYKKNV